jgi:hypothetical protein
MSYTIASASASFLHPIDSLDNSTVLYFLKLINAGKFRSVVRLFEPTGILKPPFDLPLIDRPSILAYLREEYRDVELIPEKYRSETAPDNLPQITVIGKTRIPWFGSKADIAQVWRFLLLPSGTISRLTIETLTEASI